MDNKRNYPMKEEKCGPPELENSTNQAAGTCDPKCSGSKKRKDRSRSRRRSRSRSRKMSLFQTICSGNKKRRRRRRSRVKKCKPGRKTRNPFFNFLREYRRKHCGLSAVQIAVQGAAKWNKMDDEERLPYVRIACKAKPYKKKRSGRSRSRSRSRGKRRSGRSGRRPC